MHILFEYQYSSDYTPHLQIAQVTETYEDRDAYLVRFLYGHKSVAEVIKKKDVLAVVDANGERLVLSGWSGTFKDINRERLRQYIK